MLIQMVETELAQRKQVGTYKGEFKGQSHFFGYKNLLPMLEIYTNLYWYRHYLSHAASIFTKLTAMREDVVCLQTSMLPIAMHWVMLQEHSSMLERLD